MNSKYVKFVQIKRYSVLKVTRRKNIRKIYRKFDAYSDNLTFQ